MNNSFAKIESSFLAYHIVSVTRVTGGLTTCQIELSIWSGFILTVFVYSKKHHKRERIAHRIFLLSRSLRILATGLPGHYIPGNRVVIHSPKYEFLPPVYSSLILVGIMSCSLWWSTEQVWDSLSGSSHLLCYYLCDTKYFFLSKISRNCPAYLHSWWYLTMTVPPRY